ncbi:MAG TPA: hypothetical protein VJN67_03695 [Stellaceae bacterium]|nr:hypothetical protein [Stellaceae bacterium]
MASQKRGSDIVIGLSAVVIAVTAGEPRVLTVERALSGGEGAKRSTEGLAALPAGPFDPLGHRTLELGLRSWVGEQTQLPLGYVEQLYTFADLGREKGARDSDARLVSIGYLALTREAEPTGDGAALWQNWYRYFPWEDGRRGRPAMVASAIEPRLADWAADTRNPEERRDREQRIRTTFGLAPVRWDEERVLERYELLYAAGLVSEARRDRGLAPDRTGAPLGEAMAMDHRRILATAMSRLRGKLKYRPVVFELMPPAFTLLQLQQSVEALAGVALHKQNFRRLVEQGGLVERTGEWERGTGGRPAERFRFRREVLLERPAPGVRLPIARRIALTSSG